MPSVNSKESESHYVERCVPYVMKNEGLSQKAAVGKCYGLYKSHKRHKKSKGGLCDPCWEEYLKEFDGPNYYISID